MLGATYISTRQNKLDSVHGNPATLLGSLGELRVKHCRTDVTFIVILDNFGNFVYLDII